MKNIKNITIFKPLISLGILLLISYIAYQFYWVPDNNTRISRTYHYPQVTQTSADYAISEISLHRNKIFTIEGYVLKINGCPQCNSEDICKTCAPSIIVSTHNINIKSPNNTQVLLSAPKPEQFELNKKYIFKINPSDQLLNTSEYVNRAKLIAYSPIILPPETEHIINEIYSQNPEKLQCDKDSIASELIEKHLSTMKTCSQDSECVKTNQSCSGITVVNRTYLDIYEYLTSAIQACKNCNAPPQKIENIRCENKLCTANIN